ncbi:hypothetical protein F5X99DRAFT_414895 [Biscogniauxia marginata]|nr:hypothetical protein F5X99DRAFT_414895 [Biscogniauxia marginata]
MDMSSAKRIERARGRDDVFAKRANMSARNNQDQARNNPDDSGQKDTSEKKDGGEPAK